MRILAVSDVREPLLYDHFKHERWTGTNRIDLLLSCGDLDRDYLSFLVSVLNVPALYVPGNHDTAYATEPPEGLDNVSGRVVTVNGLRIAGFPGSMRYTPQEHPYQFTERQMRGKTRRVALAMWVNHAPIDIVMSHAAPAICPEAYERCATPVGGERPCIRPDLPGHLENCPDAPDLCHQGFLSLREFLIRQRPRVWLHGHNHLSYARTKRIHGIDDTKIINVYGYHVFEYDPPGK